MRLLLIILFVGLLACEDHPVESTNCSTKATVRNLNGIDGCGWVFELSNGIRIQPFMIGWCGTPPLPKEVTEDPLFNFEYVDGKVVYIDYEIMNDAVNTCMIGPVAKITCLREASLQTTD